MQMGIDEDREQIRAQLIMEHHALAIDLADVIAMIPRQMRAEGTVLTTVDHARRHGSKLSVANEVEPSSLGTHEASHLTAHGTITSLCRAIDVVNL